MARATRRRPTKGGKRKTRRGGTRRVRKGGQLFRRGNPNAAQEQAADELSVCATHRVKDVAATIHNDAETAHKQAPIVARNMNVGEHELRNYIMQLDMILGKIIKDAESIVNCKPLRQLEDRGGKVTSMATNQSSTKPWWKFW